MGCLIRPTAVGGDQDIGGQYLSGGDNQRVGETKPAPVPGSKPSGSSRHIDRHGLDAQRQASDEVIHNPDCFLPAGHGSDQRLRVRRSRQHHCICTLTYLAERSTGSFMMSIIGVEHADDDARVEDRYSHSSRRETKEPAS